MGIRLDGTTDTISAPGSDLNLGQSGDSVKVASQVQLPTRGALSNRNLVINGAMQFSQRETSTAVTTAGKFTLDRFTTGHGSSFNLNSTISQSSTSPDGFANSLKVDVTSTSTPTGGQNGLILTRVEAQDLQHLQYGTSGAKTCTISFWVRSNKTGTYCFQVLHDDAQNYLLFEYTISAADTWEKKTITFVGNTGNIISNDNGLGLELRWHLAVGPSDEVSASSTWTGSNASYYATSNQVNLFDSTSNEWYLTGVQLELGDVATDFEHRTYSDELARCQRYYQEAGIILYTSSPDRYSATIQLPVEMRDGPAITAGGIASGSGGSMTPMYDDSNGHNSKQYFYQGSDNSLISNAWFKFDDEL